jgi:uncharacterized protein YfaS (alpha-2-macroglobulin family)
MERLLAARPHFLSLVVAVTAVTAAFVYAFISETPVGEISGRAYSALNKRPIPGARIYLNSVSASDTDDNSNDSDADRIHRYVRADANGRFRIRGVPAGDYKLSANGRKHSGQQRISVQEGDNDTIDIALTRTEAGLAINEHQRVFGTDEEAFLPVSGYADDSHPGPADQMRVQLYRARVSSLLSNKDSAIALQQIGQGDPNDSNESLPDALLKPSGGKPPSRVLTTGYPVKGADSEGFFYQKVSFGHLATGVYLVNIAHAGNSSCAWLLITDMALVVKRASGQLVAYATNMHSGKPLPGVNVFAYRDGRKLAAEHTDREGLAHLTVSEPHPAKNSGDDSGNGDSGDDEGGTSQSFTTFASNGDDEALVSQSLYLGEDNNSFRVCTYTDRPIYRPGQTIQFKGIVRALTPQSADSDAPYRVPTGEPVRVEMRNAAGDRIHDERCTTNSYGSFHGTVELSPEAATGVYTIIATLRGHKYTQDITIASYHKPEFAVTVKPDLDHAVLGDSVRMTISASYYFGAPVAGATVNYSLDRSPDWEADYPDDYDYDPAQDTVTQSSAVDRFYGESMGAGTVVLDADGKAVVTIRTSPHKDSGDMPQQDVYSLTATVHDQSREVTETGQVKVSSGNFRLTVSPDGYVSTPGKPTRLIIHALTYDQKPVTNLPVQIELQRHSWANGTFSDRNVGKLSVVTGQDGFAYTDVTPKYAGSITIRAIATDSSQHRITNSCSIYAAPDEGGDLDVRYTDLQVMTDKRRYVPGDTARVLLNAAQAGEDVLLTIEGSKVFHTQLVEMAHRSVVVQVPVLASYGPNIFIDACYVRNKHFAQSEAPLRVTVPQREIHLAITPDRPAQTASAGGPTLARYEPQDLITYRIHATDSRGAPAKCDLSFGVVDEAIYALMEDDPTRLQEAFYPRRTNSVQTGYSFAIEYLGDANKAEPKIVARKKFPDTAYWEPDIETDSSGDATVAFHLPDTLTTWRATAVAQTMDTRLGRETLKVIVTKPFFVRLETPRYLTQTDQAVITAMVHNETATVQTATVRLRAENLEVAGAGTQQVTVPPGQAVKATWNVSVPGMADATLNVAAWTPPAAGKQYTDAVEIPLPVRPHGREHVVAYAGSITQADSETEVLRLDPNAIPSASRLTIRIDQSPATAIPAAVDYLIGFPYGCTEQTMSRMMPDILVQQAVKKHILPDMLRGRNLTKMVRDSLQRLYRFQHDKGGWGWWKQDDDDAGMTAYVLYGLSVARDAGYPVSQRALDLGLSAASELFKKATNRERAALAYAVARCGNRADAQGMLSAVSFKKIDAAGIAYIAMTDRLLGLSDADALQHLSAAAIETSTMTHWSGSSFTDYNGVEATSLALEAILAANPQDPRADRVLHWLMRSRTGEMWYSTGDTAAAVNGMCAYLTTHPPAVPGGDVRISVNGHPIQQFHLNADTLAEKELVFSAPVSVLRPEKNDVLIERLGSKAQIFYSVALHETIAENPLPPVGPKECSVVREYTKYVRTSKSVMKNSATRLNSQITGTEPGKMTHWEPLQVVFEP